MINKVEICGVNTAKLPVLSNEEKYELLKRIKDGDNEARQKFIKGNLKLVLSVIKRFRCKHENADDLFQVGCIGLIKALDNLLVSRNKKAKKHSFNKKIYKYTKIWKKAWFNGTFMVKY